MNFDIGIGRASHDLVFDASGNMLLIDGPERVAQDLKIALLMFYGEYFFDRERGIDYFGTVLVKNPDKILIESLLRASVSEVRDIIQVLDLQLAMDHQNRKLSVYLNVLTPYGELTLESFLNDNVRRNP